MGTVAAWDGGGTKTEVLLENGTLLSRVFGPLNLNGNTSEEVLDTCRNALHFVREASGDFAHLDAMVIGAAGISNTDACRQLEIAIRSAGYAGPLAIVGDHEIALAGAIRGSGCVLVSGTGSVCNGRNLETGKTVRTGGYGYLIDDDGSGYAIGRDILRAVVRAQDGRGEKTCLTGLVFDQLSVPDLKGIITWLYHPATGKQAVAALGRLLTPALESSDAAAIQIAEKAAADLSCLVLTAMRRLELEAGEAALTGSVLEKNDWIRKRVEQLLTSSMSGIRVHAPLHTPAQGALQLAHALAERQGGNHG